ncbi:MAG: GGDEF domain-containing protein [Nitrospirota bacterium]|nr:GGDEF domain-containing protein [Nitrospirota bacterium]
MNSTLQEKLQSCPNLPSPPTIAVQILQLANEPEIDLKNLTKMLSCDPALACKILKMANSPIYAYSRKVDNLHQAVMILGLNAVIALSLSFSLTKALINRGGIGLDYSLFWKRALLAGAASRVLGQACGLRDLEALYLASLLQDIGMLALDQLYPDLYTIDSQAQASHGNVILREREMLQTYHAEVGSWLLEQWGFPSQFCLAAAHSDDPWPSADPDEQTRFINCVALSGKIAEIFVRNSSDEFMHTVNQQIRKGLPVDNNFELIQVLEDIQGLIPEIEDLFDVKIQTWDYPDAIVEQARETLLRRSLDSIKKVEELQACTTTMECEFEQFKEKHKLDGLTGALNRIYLDECLQFTFQRAITKQETLTIAFCDLDKFKKVNDTYGHQTGDAILQAAGTALTSTLRATDTVGRYGGDEFIIILPKASGVIAKRICERIVKLFKGSKIDHMKDDNWEVTMSFGIATHSPDTPCTNVTDLLEKADKALYYVKSQGGNKIVLHDTIKAEQPRMVKKLERTVSGNLS